MKPVKNNITPELIALFEVEELEERLENKWALSTTAKTDENGSSISVTASVQFE
ncbi:MAG: hypothetical protein RLZ73_1679 [Bacteroidota bacterium]|jgi:hypothetical protein